MALRAGTRRTVARGAFLFLAELALGFVSYVVVLPPIGAPAFWLSNGLAIALLVRYPRTRWRELLLAVSLANGVVFAAFGTALWVLLVWVAGDLVEIVVAAVLIRRLAGRDVSLGRLGEVAIVVVGAVIVGPFVGGIVAGPTAAWLPGVSFGNLLVVWWFTDGLGSALMTPLVLAWAAPPWARATRREAARVCAATAAVAAVFLLVFGMEDESLRVILLAFTTFPLLGWMAVRHGARGATAAACAIGAIALWQTAANRGPFAFVGSLHVQLLAVQGFVALTSITALIASALAEEGRRAARSRAILLDTASTLGESLPLDERLHILAGRLVPRLAPGVSVWVRRAGELVEVARAAEDRRSARAVARRPEARRQERQRRRLVVPLGRAGAPGHLAIAVPRGGLDPEARALARVVADRIGVAVETHALRRQNEERLAELEASVARLDTVLRSAPVGFAFLDRDLGFVQVSENFAALDGIAAEDHRGRHMREVLPASLQADLLPLVRQVLETGQPITDRELRLDRGGRTFDVLASAYPVRLAAGPPAGLGLLLVDISSRKREELALSLSEQRFRSLAQATAEIVWIADGSGTSMRATPSWSAFTGEPPEAMVGTRWLDAIHPDDRAAALRTWREAIPRGEPFAAEFRLRRHDGVYRYVESRAAPVRDPDGQVREWVGMAFDITERKEAEAERSRLFAESQEAIRVRDDFLSIASHELKTPLTPLSIRLQLLARRVSGQETITVEDIERARASLEQLTGLINDLLDASRVQSQRLGLHFEALSLTELVVALCETYETASERHVIERDLDGEEQWVLGDRRRLEQVFGNLIDNAIKYSPGGGTICVRLHPTDGEAVLSVADPGIGIPPAEQERLFDRFFRARNVSPRSYGGLGLGLYISRDIVERHGGRIWVESELGEGSTFYVSLPRLHRPHAWEGAAAP